MGQSSIPATEISGSVHAPSASQFSAELEQIRAAETLLRLRERSSIPPSSMSLETVPETQEEPRDDEVLLPSVGTVRRLPLDFVTRIPQHCHSSYFGLYYSLPITCHNYIAGAICRAWGAAGLRPTTQNTLSYPYTRILLYVIQQATLITNFLSMFIIKFRNFVT